MTAKVSLPFAEPTTPPSPRQARYRRRLAQHRATLADLRARIDALEAKRLADRRALDQLGLVLTNILSAFVSGWLSGSLSQATTKKACN